MKYTYLIDYANRGDLIEEVLERRKDWDSDIPTKYRGRGQWKVIPRYIIENKWNFIWRRTVNVTYGSEKFNIFSIPSSSKTQLVNRFPNSEVITRKTNLVRSLRKTFGEYPFIPETYILGEDVESFVSNPYVNDQMWIVKPEFLFSGKGIELFDNLEDITNHIENIQRKGTDEWVVQQYIKNPLLLDGRKFDIRINVLVTDNFDIYINPFGFVRTIGDLYYPFLTGNKEKDQLVHITNHSIQKNSETFGKYEESNVISLPQLQSYFDYVYNGHINIERDLFPQWMSIIKDTIMSGKDEMIKGIGNRRCFEIFGFDFLIDDNFKSWLLEVNTNTGLEQDIQWADKVVRRMLEEMAHIVIDPLFKSKIVKNVPKEFYDVPPQGLKWLKSSKTVKGEAILYGPSWIKF